MKKQIRNTIASRLVNCGMVVLVSCGYKGRRNITTCAWHMPFSKEPPLIAVALAKKHFSSELIRKSEEFVVNIPVWEQLEKVVLCGSLKGREVDKFKEAGFTSGEPHVLKEAPIVGGSVSSLECKLVEIKEAGDHFVFMGEVVYTEVVEEYFRNDVWDTEKVEFIFHLGGKYFFKSSSPQEVL